MLADRIPDCILQADGVPAPHELMEVPDPSPGKVQGDALEVVRRRLRRKEAVDGISDGFGEAWGSRLVAPVLRAEDVETALKWIRLARDANRD